MFQKFFLSLSLFSVVNAYDNCPQIQTVNNLNLTEYIRAPWYIQMQQETPYLPNNTNYCVLAKYNRTQRSVPFFSGTVLSVYNYANRDRVNGYNLNKNNYTLCARVPNANETSKLIVAPCFLPNIFGGDYWILYAGPQTNNYEYAIVSGGPTNIRYNNGCSTSTTNINNSGLWIFTRNQTVSDSLIENLIVYLVSRGITPELLNKVNQTGCLYH